MVKAAPLLAGLPQSPVLVVDTAPIIYWLEGHARFAARFAEVFHAAESGDASIVISTVTLARLAGLALCCWLRSGGWRRLVGAGGGGVGLAGRRGGWFGCGVGGLGSGSGLQGKCSDEHGDIPGGFHGSPSKGEHRPVIAVAPTHPV